MKFALFGEIGGVDGRRRRGLVAGGRGLIDGGLAGLILEGFALALLGDECLDFGGVGGVGVPVFEEAIIAEAARGEEVEASGEVVGVEADLVDDDGLGIEVHEVSAEGGGADLSGHHVDAAGAEHGLGVGGFECLGECFLVDGEVGGFVGGVGVEADVGVGEEAKADEPEAFGGEAAAGGGHRAPRECAGGR